MKGLERERQEPQRTQRSAETAEEEGTKARRHGVRGRRSAWFSAAGETPGTILIWYLAFTCGCSPLPPPTSSPHPEKCPHRKQSGGGWFGNSVGHTRVQKCGRRISRCRREG